MAQDYGTKKYNSRTKPKQTKNGIIHVWECGDGNYVEAKNKNKKIKTSSKNKKKMISKSKRRNR